MLRLAVLVLLLANVGYYGWASGLLAPWGLAPAQQGEPERLAQQIAPQTLQVLPADDPPAAPTPPASRGTPPEVPTPAPAAGTGPAGNACLQSGPLDDAQAKALQPLLAALPPGSWTLVQVPVAGRWMVYMGRFADEEALAKKRAELSALKLAFDRPAAGFEPGLALGRFATEEAAQRALADLANRGVRSARVVLERPSQTRTLLRLGAVDAPLRGQLQPLQDALGAAGSLHPCDPAPANP